MANTKTIYTDEQIMKALLSKDFSGIGGIFEDDAIDSVRRCAFQDAVNLTRVTLPSLLSVSSGCFKGSSITNLDLSWNDITEVGSESFYGALGSRTSLVMPKLIKAGDGAFGGNPSLTSVSLALFTGALTYSESYYSTSYQGLFRDCSGLTSVSLPELTNMPGSMFRACTSLQELVLPKVTSVAGSCFYGCTNLKKVTFKANVTSLGSSLFNNDRNLEALVLKGLTGTPTITSSTFNNSGIASGSGYIYVPSALVDTIKGATYWSTYRDMIRACEDYPSICGD